MRDTFKFFLFGCLWIMILLVSGCNEKKVETSKSNDYTESILLERAKKDSSLKIDTHSPFKQDPKATFKPLNYYEPNPDFVFKSKLFRPEIQDTITISGTKGETRPVIIVGFFEFKKDKETYKINLYKGFSRTGEEYYSMWFTDRTTGKETYGVGRYLDFELNENPEFVYTIDFNRAYNPYCAYSSLFSCPIPRVEDYIDMEIEAGEKNFH